MVAIGQSAGALTISDPSRSTVICTVRRRPLLLALLAQHRKEGRLGDRIQPGPRVLLLPAGLHLLHERPQRQRELLLPEACGAVIPAVIRQRLLGAGLDPGGGETMYRDRQGRGCRQRRGCVRS